MEMVREDTNHGDKENILLQIIWACPKPRKEEKSKKDFHCYPSCKTHSGKKCQLWVCPGHLNPMARMPIERICHLYQ
jgi:hypothetical protein